MRLVEQHTIKLSSIYYNELYDLLHKCKNLYNKGLYVVRQHYFQYNVAFWIMNGFVNMNLTKEEGLNEDCLKLLLVGQLMLISMVLLTSSVNRKKNPLM